MTTATAQAYTSMEKNVAPAQPSRAASGTQRTWRLSKRSILGLVATAAVLSGGGWYARSQGHESTDDAQVDAEVVAVPARAAGTITRICFTDNQTVRAGELLATLDDDVAKARLGQAEAALESARATAEAAEADATVEEADAVGNKAASAASLESSAAAVSVARDQIGEAAAARASADALLHQARSDVERGRALFASGSITRLALDQSETAFAVAQSNVDAARARVTTLRRSVAQATGRAAEAAARAHQSSNVESYLSQARARAKAARAQVATAQAAVDLAALDLSYTRVVAPHDGVVSRKTIAEGQAVTVGQPIVQLVTPGVWVTANFKETQLEHIRTGQPVEISADAFPSVKIRGEVESFSGGTGSRFTLLPPDNASGNYTKVIQRIPVRLRVALPPEGIVLRPGMSVEVTVSTRS
jgi:membrane fusion protein (multidrug efflux system)